MKSHLKFPNAGPQTNVTKRKTSSTKHRACLAALGRSTWPLKFFQLCVCSSWLLFSRLPLLAALLLGCRAFWPALETSSPAPWNSYLYLICVWVRIPPKLSLPPLSPPTPTPTPSTYKLTDKTSLSDWNQFSQRGDAHARQPRQPHGLLRNMFCLF